MRFLSRIFENPAFLVSVLLILLGAGCFGLRADLQRFKRSVPVPGDVRLPTGYGLVPEYTRACSANTAAPSFALVPSDAVRTAVESIRKSNKARYDLPPERYSNLWRLLDELDSCGEFAAHDVAMKSLLGSAIFTIQTQQEHFLRYVGYHSFRVLKNYFAREDWAGARRQVRRIIGWLENWDPPANIASVSYSGFQLQAMLNVMYRLDALLDDIGLFFRERETALLILRSTLSGKPLPAATLAFAKTSNSPEVQAWGNYLEAAGLLRSREFESAIRSFVMTVKLTKNDRLRDLALLGAARSHYWRAKNNPAAVDRARSSIETVRRLIRRKSLMDDIDYYAVRVAAK